LAGEKPADSSGPGGAAKIAQNRRFLAQTGTVCSGQRGPAAEFEESQGPALSMLGIARSRSREGMPMAYAIKTEVHDPGAKAFSSPTQGTMYGGKHIAAGGVVFVFASENEGSHWDAPS
jgi:hypothetical protein